MPERSIRLSAEIRKGTRDEILSLVSSSSIISPYEILPDATVYVIEENHTIIGYLSGRISVGKRIDKCLPSARIFFVDVLEIKKTHRRKGYGRILFSQLRKDIGNLDIGLLATRFSLPFWMAQSGAEGLDYFGKSRYIIFRNEIT